MTAAGLVTLASFALTPIAVAQASAAKEQAENYESIIVTGTRQSNRTVFDSMAPIDLIGGEALNSTTSEDLLDSVAQLVPSFKGQRLPMADGQVFVRPASLRG